MRLLLLLLAACIGPKEGDDSSPAPDQDADGYPAGADCDDADPAIHPGASEVCGGGDEDCDGVVDEADAEGMSAWYADSDGDAYGDPSAPALACAQPNGHVADATDCDDSTESASPAAAEICDGIDNNCDGVVDESSASDALAWYADSDGDTFGDAQVTQSACAPPSGYVADDTDCDDTRTDISPLGTEVCDTLDNDCDTLVDEESTDAATWYADADGDSFGDPLNTNTACTQPSGFVADLTDCDDTDAAISPITSEICDSRDNDCDTLVDEDEAIDAAIWYADADTDGFGDTAFSAMSCTQPSGFVADDTDCDDADPFTNPIAPEVCGGGDEDCDNITDENDAVDAGTWYADSDADGFGDPTVAALSCTQPSSFVADASDCDDGDSATNPAEPELCGGGDEDCDNAVDESTAMDAQIWYADSDGDGYGSTTSTTTSCTQPSGYLAQGTDCDDANPIAYPYAPERCGGGDEDCDGTVDEPSAVDMGTWYVDADGDGFGDASSSARACVAPSGHVDDDTDCDDNAPGTWPGAPEQCGAPDQDCDGRTDDPESTDTTTFYTDDDGDGYGDPNAPVDACNLVSGLVTDSTDCDDSESTANPAGSEECWNGIDEDCDPNSASCTASACSLSESFATISGLYANERIGMSVDVGDINGDGELDFALGSYGSTAYILQGPFSGDRNVSTAEFSFSFASDLGSLTNAFTMEDLDGSGSMDLVMGMPFSDRGGTSYDPQRGAILLFVDPPRGAYTDTDADTVWLGETSFRRIGWAVESIDDVNGDGVADLATLDRRASYSGAVFVLSGADRGTVDVSSVALATITPDAPNAWYDLEFEVSQDLDGDGMRDILVSDIGNTRTPTTGSVWVIPGPPPMGNSTIDSVGYRIAGTYNNGNIASIHDAGDLDGDGFSDILIAEQHSSASGIFYVMLGPFSSSATFADAIASVLPQPGNMIDDLSTGDVDGDGSTDIVAYVGDTLGGGPGQSFVYLELPQGYLINSGHASIVFDSESAPHAGDVRLDAERDFNGDALNDLVTVTQRGSVNSYYEGVVHLISGSME